jgi:hypothetical protein
LEQVQFVRAFKIEWLHAKSTIFISCAKEILNLFDSVEFLTLANPGHDWSMVKDGNTFSDLF